MTKGVNAAAKALRDFESQTSGTGKNLDQIGVAGTRAGQQVASGAERATQSIRELARSTTDVSASFDKISGAAGLVGGALAAGLGIAAKSASDFQAELAAISTIKPDVNVTQIGDALQAMSTRVAQSQTQLAESLYGIFGSVEVSQAQALQLTEQFSKGAIAARTDAETFGNSILGVLASYGQGVDQAEHASDVFFRTVADGVVSGEALAHGLGGLAQSANAAGVSFDELGAIVAGATKTGGAAETTLNNIQNLLSKITTTDVQAGFEKLGIATKTADGSFRDILDVLGDLDTALSKLSQSQRAQVLQDLFPDQQARLGLQSVLSQLQFIQQEADGNAKAIGVMDAAYAKMGSTAQASGTILKNSLVSTLGELGNLALPGLTSAAEKVEAFLKVIDGLPEGVKRIGVEGGLAAAGMLLLAGATGKVVSITRDLLGPLRDVTRAFGEKEAAKKSLTAANETLAKSMGKTATSAGLVRTAVIPAAEALGVLAGVTAAGAGFWAAIIAAMVKYRDATGGTTKMQQEFILAQQASNLALKEGATFENNHLANFLRYVDSIPGGVHNVQELDAAWQQYFDNQQRAGNDVTGLTRDIVVTTTEVHEQAAAVDDASSAWGRYTVEQGKASDATAQAFLEQQRLLTTLDKGPTGRSDTSGIDAVTAAYRAEHDAISFAEEAAARHRAELEGLDQRYQAISGAMSQLSQVSSPLTAALDQINSKIAAGIPLTTQEAGLYQQIPGYLGEATTATSSLALALAQTAIDSANAAGGVSAMGGAFTGAAGQAAGLAGELNRLLGVQQNLDSASRAFSAEDAQLTDAYNKFKARVDALNQQKKDQGGVLSPEDQAELDHYQSLLDEIAGKLGENAAKERELAEARLKNGDAAAEAAKKIAEANKADLAAKQDPFAFREDHRGEAPVAPEPVVVPLDPVVNAAQLVAARQSLGEPVTVPIVADLGKLGGGQTNAALSIAQSMGIAAPGGTPGVTINVTADTGPADTAIATFTGNLKAIPDKHETAITATDTASPVAATVTTNIGAVPPAHDTIFTATDIASGVIAGLISTINSVPSSFSVVASVDTSGALAAIADLRANMPSSPAEKGPFRTLPDWSSVFGSLQPASDRAVASLEETTRQMAETIGAGIDAVSDEAAGSAADLAAKVAAAVDATADAFDRIRAIRLPNPVQFERFRAAMLPLLDAFAEDGAARGEDAAKSAAGWADSAQKVFSSVSAGADALAKLRDFVRPADKALRDFRDASQFLTNLMEQVAADSDAGLTEAGAQWADAASGIFQAVGSGVDALTKLQDFQRPTDKAATDFRDISQFVVNLLAQVAADIEDQALPKAKDWSETASSIFGALSSGVDGLTKLHEFARPTDQAVESFRDVAQFVVNLMAQVAADIEGQALPKAKEWAETAIAIFGALSSGVDALAKLGDFTRPTDDAVRSFRDAAQLAVNLIAEAAAQTDTQLVQAAATYADGAGKVLALIGSGSSTLSQIGKEGFTPPSKADLDRIAASSREAVLAVAAAAQTVSTELVGDAADYSDGAGKAVQLIGSGFQAFSQIAGFVPPSQQQIDQLVAVTVETVRRIAEAARTMDQEAVKAAGEFGENGGKAIGVVGTTIAAFANMQEFVPPSKEAIDGVVALVDYTAHRLGDIAGSFDPALLAKIGQFGDGVSSGLSAIRSALDLGKTFQDEDRVKPADAIGTALQEFQDGLGPLGQLLTLSQQYKSEGEQIGANIAASYAAIAASLPGFTPQSQAAASVTVGGGQTTVVHRFAGAIDFRFLGDNGRWIVSSLTVDDQALTQTSDLIAGKLLPIFEAAAT